MYQEYFQLAERPFKNAPFAPDYFPNRYCEQALQLCCLAIDEATGPVLVFGGTGVGKSMLLSVIAEQYASRFNVVQLTTASLKSPLDLLQNILFELDRPYQEMLEGELRLSLMEHLKPDEKCPNGILILADEAHTLSESILDELKSITNYVRDGKPRVRLILAGNSKLEETMTSPRLDSFSQRIAARCYLQPMAKAETEQYIDKHLQRVGQSSATVFEQPAIDAIYEISQGIPRLINQLCCHGMILAAAHGSTKVNRQHVSQAWTDIQQLPTPWGEDESQDGEEKLDDWAIIEFGQLDETTNAAEPSFESSSPDSISGDMEIEVSAGGTGENAGETETDDENWNAVSETVFSTNPFDEEFSIEGTATDANTLAATAEPGCSDNKIELPVDSEDIFGGGFDPDEEIVVDEFSRWSAEQNRTSLDVTDEELTRLVSQANQIHDEIGNSLDGPEIGPEVILPDSNSTASPGVGVQSPVKDHNPEIQQLYEIYDNQKQLAKQIAVAAKPSDPGTASSWDSDSSEPGSNPNPMAIEYPIDEHPGFAGTSNTAGKTLQADDRDMLMVSHVDNAPSGRDQMSDMAEIERPTSTGQAIRMNYQTLFQQLRGQDTVT